MTEFSEFSPEPEEQAVPNFIQLESPTQLNSEEILQVEFFKVDRFSTDQIIVWIFLKSGDILWATEDDNYIWRTACYWLDENLSGFYSGWYGDVVMPAFEECRTIAYPKERIGTSEFIFVPPLPEPPPNFFQKVLSRMFGKKPVT